MTPPDRRHGLPMTQSRTPGFRFRPYRGPADHPGMVRTNMAARRADGVVEPVTVEGMDHTYATMPNCDPLRDAIVCEAGDGIVAYGRVEWGDHTDGGRDYETICYVDPGVRRRGIGGGMLGWLEGRAREVAAGQVTDRPRHHAASASDRDTGANVLLLAEGYRAVRHGAEMVRPDLDGIPAVPAPPGLAIRHGSARDSRAVWDANVEIFRDDWGTLDASPGRYARFVDDPGFDPSLWVVAWDAEEIAGVVLASVQPGAAAGEILGYLDSVGVRRPWRRRGVGRALVARALRDLRDRGATSVGLGVDLENQNHAAALYRGLGFETRTTSTAYRKPLILGGTPD